MPQAETITGRTEEWWPRIDQRLAVLIPCFNEETAIARVIAGFRAELPEATIYVYDNNSTDNTLEVARAAGAVVRRETHQGKGHVVRRMFADVEADVYVLVDGDATYDACSVRAMIARQMEERLDMVVAARVEEDGGCLSPRPSHRQPAVHRLLRLGVRRDLHRHPLRLSRVLAAVREVVSGAVAGVRDRDRAFRPRARARPSGGRGPDPLLCAAGRVDLEAQHLARWLAHPAHHRRALPLGAAADVLLRSRHRFGGRFPLSFRFRSS